MHKYAPRLPAQFVVPLNMNGLKGRMLRLPPSRGKRREILLVYDRHAMLERYYGLAETLNEYGGVTVPDLPGFGGMDSFYSIGEKPDLDNLADYLAAFVKLRYGSRKRFSVVAVGFGFAVATRMLQRYPEIAARVDYCISLGGLARHDDLRMSRLKRRLQLHGARLLSRRGPTILARPLALQPRRIRRRFDRQTRESLRDISPAQRKTIHEFEIRSWRKNGLRTHMDTLVTLLTFDNCRVRLDVPVWHVTPSAEELFDNGTTEQHLRVVFRRVRILKPRLATDHPFAYSDRETAATLLPRALVTMLNKDK